MKRPRQALLQEAKADAGTDEARYRAIVEATDDAVCCWLPDTTLTFCNARYRELFGLGAKTAVGQKWLDLVPAGERDSVTAFYRELAQQPRRVAHEHAATAADGTSRWISWVDAPLFDAAGRLREFQSVGRDITERKRAERALQRANRALHTRSECSRALAEAANEDALLGNVCRLLVEFGGYRMAWVGMAVDDAARSVRPVVAAGADDGYVESIRISWADNDYGRGPTGIAIRERHPAIARDIASEPRFERWREAARRHGFASSIALPLLSDETHCIGALNIYAAEADAFDSDEGEFLAELAKDLAYGVRVLRERGARHAVEKDLQEASRRMAQLLRASAVIVYSHRLSNGRMVPHEVSENVERLLGYSLAEALADDWWFNHLHPDDRETVHAANERLFAEGRLTRLYRFAHKDGRYLWINDDQRVVRAADGRPFEIIGAWTDVTERMQAEQALRESETRMRAMFEQAAVGIAQVAPDGRWLRVNDKLCEIVGYARDELLRASFQDITHPDDLEIDMRHLRRLLAGELRTYSIDKRYVRKDGAIVWIKLTVSRVRRQTGEPDYFISVVEDITAQRQSQESLREMSALARIGAWELDLASSRVWWSDETYRLYGVSRQTFAHTVPAFLQLIHPDDRTAMQSWIEACLAGRRPGDLEFRTVHPGGEVRVLSGRGELRLDAHNKPWRMLGTVQDITARRLAEDALRDREERLRLAVTAARQGIYDLNVRTGEAKVTREYASMLGFDPETFRETNAAWIERLHPDDREPVAAVYRDYIAGKIPEYRVEFRQRTAAGDWIWILSLGRVVEYDAQGAPLRMLGTHTDITDRRLAEEALRASEQRYREMFLANPQPMWVYDLETLRFLAVNDAAVTHYGYRRDEFLAMTISDIRPPEDVPRLLANVAQVRDGIDEAGVWRHRRRDGSLIFVEIVSHVLSFDGRRAEVVLASDITERLRVEGERQAALERFETLFRSAPEAISITEFESGRFLQVNDAFCRMLGFAREELIGRTALELNSWSNPQQRRQVLAELRAGRRVTAMPGRARMRSGELRETQFSAERIDFGGTESLLMMLVDLTERVQAQRQLEAQEQQLKELTRRLMTKEEEERKALAQTLHDRFAQNLAAAKLGLEGALMGAARAGRSADSELPKALRRVIGSLDESITDVRGLLAELRPPLLAEFGLRAALRQEIDSRRALGRGVDIVLRAESAGPSGWAAQRLAPTIEYGLFMIAREALANALLHAGARRIEVEFNVDDERVLVGVRDDGVGFDSSRLQSPGHLGLTGMRERAALIGARLQIETAIGRGTTVTVAYAAGA